MLASDSCLKKRETKALSPCHPLAVVVKDDFEGECWEASYQWGKRESKRECFSAANLLYATHTRPWMSDYTTVSRPPSSTRPEGIRGHMSRSMVWDCVCACESENIMYMAYSICAICLLCLCKKQHFSSQISLFPSCIR